MAQTETYYLIDFENVHEDGLIIHRPLTSHDHVYLFSTKNAPQVKIAVLANLNSSDLNLKELPPGSQSLDKHLLSFLGFLIGANINAKGDFHYVIVSKDKGYDNIASFWRTEMDVDVVRQISISPDVTEEQLSSKKSSKSKSKSAGSKGTKTSSKSGKTDRKSAKGEGDAKADRPQKEGEAQKAAGSTKTKKAAQNNGDGNSSWPPSPWRKATSSR